MRYTEMTFTSRVSEIMNKLIERDREKLPFDRSDIEVGLDGGRADLILWINRKSNPALLIEIEPEEDVEKFFDEVKEKAQTNRIPYFAIWNLRRFRLWKTPYFGEDLEVYDTKYDENVLNRFIELEYVMDSKEQDIEKFFKKFLSNFSESYRKFIKK